MLTVAVIASVAVIFALLGNFIVTERRRHRKIPDATFETLLKDAADVSLRVRDLDRQLRGGKA
jgi:hypothetical protein